MKQNQSVLSRRVRIAARFIPLALAAACASAVDEDDGAAGPDLSQFVTESSADGAITSVTRQAEPGSEPSAPLPEGTPGDELEDGLIEKAGCTHIRFCNAAGAQEVICDTNDRPCSREARLSECFSDADAVCGNWTRMDFDPPI
jgi:hypothetical protein